MKIEDYGFIGDTETSALVGRDGSVDWLCFPRFDSGACFAKLLGTDEHGFWKIAPAADEEIRATRRRYRGDTLILENEFETAGGTVRLIDFMPVRGTNPDMVRIVEGVRGTVRIAMTLVIRFDYGSVVPWVRRGADGLEMIAGPDALVLRTPAELRGQNLTTVAEFSVRAGERVPFVLTWFPSHEKPPKRVDAEHALRDTETWWTGWSSRCTTGRDGEWAGAVRRSLITLKGLTYRPTGGIVAAATASLPEQIGGVRNWDYRFCWLRDATFTLLALMLGGYTDEARSWRDWLLRAIAGSAAQLQIMYGAAGERRLTELEIPWLPGYENSKPVRVGNAAHQQFQLDVYGELMDALHQTRVLKIGDSDNLAWALQRQLILFLESHWSDPDEGIWEVRGPRQNFTHSKVMAWVAMDRAVQAVEKFGLAGPVDRWRALRAKIHAEVCAKGFSEKRGTFVQSYGSDALDASLLMIALTGFLPADDPRVRATIEAIERELMSDGLVLRNLSGEKNDGLPPGEGTFLLCTFWLADCLALLGRADDARALFERLLAVRNDLGLLAEEYDTRLRRQVGNFPQAFSHVGLINTAHNLSQARGPAQCRCH